MLLKVSEYISKVLNATGFYNGFAHTEIFVDRQGTIKLIEINPRLSGGRGVGHKLARLNQLPDQIDLFLTHVFATKQALNSQAKSHSRCLILSNLAARPLYNLSEHLSCYNNVHEIIQLVPDGHIPDPNDITLVNSAAFVLLQAHSIDDLQSDTADILAQDKLGWN